MKIIYESIANDIIAEIAIWPGSKKRREQWARNWVAVAQRYAPEGWLVLSVNNGGPASGIMTAVIDVDQRT
jgi:hypothetical protein